MTAFVIVFSFVWSAAARADHPTVTLGSGLSGPIITVQASTLPRGRVALSFRTELVRFETRSDTELQQIAAQGEELDDLGSLFSPAASVAYGVTDALTVGARLPYLLRSDIRTAELDHGVARVPPPGAGIGSHGQLLRPAGRRPTRTADEKLG